MHSKGIIFIPRLTKAMRRRWLVRFTELCIEMAAMAVGCVLVALIISACLKGMGVA